MSILNSHQPEKIVSYYYLLLGWFLRNSFLLLLDCNSQHSLCHRRSVVSTSLLRRGLFRTALTVAWWFGGWGEGIMEARGVSYFVPYSAWLFLSLFPSFPARPPTPNRELLRRREWPLSTPPPKALAFDWKLFRNEKLHGTAYHKRCQRRIYKKFKHKQGTARLILRRTDKAGSQNCEQSGQLFRPYWDSSALCSEDM